MLWVGVLTKLLETLRQLPYLRLAYLRFQSLCFGENSSKSCSRPLGTAYQFQICPDSRLTKTNGILSRTMCVLKLICMLSGAPWIYGPCSNEHLPHNPPKGPKEIVVFKWSESRVWVMLWLDPFFRIPLWGTVTHKLRSFGSTLLQSCLFAGGLRPLKVQA